MEEQKIRQMFEQIDPKGEISQSKIEEFIATAKSLEDNPLKDGDKIGDATFNYLENLKDQLEHETDWRKRASLSAKMISINLEN